MSNFDDSSTLQLPNYTPSAPLPSYTHELASGERRLQHSPRSNTRYPSSVFIRKSRKATVVLSDQEDGVAIPTFGRTSVISGSISLNDRHNILNVQAYVEGKLETTYSDAGGGTYTLLENNYTLWSRPSMSHDMCPGDIPFAFILPSSFTNGDETVPLPPSYLRHFVDVPILYVRVSYQLRFAITRVPCRKLGIWHLKKRIVIPFQYLPRTRAHRPILRTPTFFSSVKTCPEEWYQAVTCLKTQPNVRLGPIDCHLFLPAGRVYSVKDSIPFHVQLSTDTDVLTELFSGASLNRITSADTDNNFSRSRTRLTAKPLLRVYLVRQVRVSTKKADSFRNTVLGEGVIRPVPPEFSCSCSCNASGVCRERHVDWEGEVCCKDEIAGSFNVMHVQVKDFITLSLSPPKSRPSPFLDLHVSVPIKLVTDSFSDGLMDTAL